MKQSKEQLIDKLKQLDEEMSILKSHERLFKCRCRICNLTGCDILSFEHRGSVHIRCLIQLVHSSALR